MAVIFELANVIALYSKLAQIEATKIFQHSF